MSAAFVIIALVTLLSAIAAITLRNLVHCALTLTVAFAGLAAIYLQLGAQFVGFVQGLVYVGAVAILIVFALLLTRGTEPGRTLSARWPVGAAIALAVFALIASIVLSSHALPGQAAPQPEATVRQIGDQLMTTYIVPLEVIGLLLTAALIGAVIIALPEKESKPRPPAKP